MIILSSLAVKFFTFWYYNDFNMLRKINEIMLLSIVINRKIKFNNK